MLRIHQKLTGLSMGTSGYAQLWSGPDHLLEVTTYGFSERYRRFYWREIEAVIVRRTAVRRIWNLISGAFAALSVAGLAVSLHYSAQSDSTPVQIALGFAIGICTLIAVISLVILLVNTLLGPRCICVIKMSAGTQRLAAPNRLRVALRVVEKIAPLIEAAQTERVLDESSP